MRVVVAGATGFIGTSLVRALQQRGDDVIVLTRSPRRALQELGGNVEAVQWDPRSRGPWMDVFRGAGAAINLAGHTVASPFRPWTAEEKGRIRSSRLDATNAVVDAIIRAEPRPRVLINASAVGYYGSRGGEILTETSAPGSDFLAQVVVDWEAAARRVEGHGVRLVLSRSGIVLGRGGGILQYFTLPFRFFGGGTMGEPDQWVSWIHLDDEVGLFLLALDDDRAQGPTNFTAPNPVTMQQFSGEIGQAMHRPSWVPFYGSMMRLTLGQRASVALLASQRAVPEAALRDGYEFRYRRSDEALRSLLGSGGR